MGPVSYTHLRVRQLADISVFVDTPLDICFIRRLQRDMEERGRSLQSVIDQYLSLIHILILPLFMTITSSDTANASVWS